MTERLSLDQGVREIAVALLEQRRSALSDLGLRATVELKQWSNEGRDSSEIRIAFWRENSFVDVIEDLIVQDGRPAASTDEFRRWLEQSIDGVLEESRGG